MRVVVAVGGKALLDPPDSSASTGTFGKAAQALLPLSGHELVIVPGCQLGTDRLSEPGQDLDIELARAQGEIGYRLSQNLDRAGAQRTTVALLTRTVVDRGDPAFSRPRRFVGPAYPAAAVPGLVADRGWTMSAAGAGLRRVVAAPAPVEVPETGPIELLLSAGHNVVCAGGGGVPVAADDVAGEQSGVCAVVDADLVAAHLAIELQADRLLLLTDVTGIHADWGSERNRLLRHVSCAKLSAMPLPELSMGVKARAGQLFTSLTGRPSAIGALAEAAAVLEGAAGTRISSTRCSAYLPPER